MGFNGKATMAAVIRCNTRQEAVHATQRRN